MPWNWTKRRAQSTYASSVRGLKWPRRSFARSVGSSFDLGCRDSSEAFVLEHCSLASSPPGPPSFPGRRHPWAAPDYSRLLQDDAVEARPPRLVADYTKCGNIGEARHSSGRRTHWRQGSGRTSSPRLRPACVGSVVPEFFDTMDRMKTVSVSFRSHPANPSILSQKDSLFPNGCSPRPLPWRTRFAALDTLPYLSNRPLGYSDWNRSHALGLGKSWLAAQLGEGQRRSRGL